MNAVSIFVEEIGKISQTSQKWTSKKNKKNGNYELVEALFIFSLNKWKTFAPHKSQNHKCDESMLESINPEGLAVVQTKCYSIIKNLKPNEEISHFWYPIQ